MSSYYLLEILEKLIIFYENLPPQPHSPARSLDARSQAYVLFTCLTPRSMDLYEPNAGPKKRLLQDTYASLIFTIHKTFTTRQIGPVYERPT